MFGKLAYIDIYNKSRMIGDHYVLFCERGRLELPFSTRRRAVVFHTVQTHRQLVL